MKNFSLDLLILSIYENNNNKYTEAEREEETNGIWRAR